MMIRRLNQVFIGVGIIFLIIWAYLRFQDMRKQDTQNVSKNSTSDLPGLVFEDTTTKSLAPIESHLWRTLLDIQYEQEGDFAYKPHFQAKHWELHQKNVVLEGYMYPLNEDKNQKFFMLSQNPVSACFFCGGAGPESIIEVNSPKGIPFSENVIQIKGKLHLNTTDRERLFYILEEAEVVKK